MINTIYGVRGVNTTRKQVFKIIKASRLQEFIKLIIPESTPQIIAGLRIAVSHTMALVVVTEMLVGTLFGIGDIIQTEQLLYNIPEMYTYIISLGFIGFFLNKSIILLERKIVFWNFS